MGPGDRANTSISYGVIHLLQGHTENAIHEFSHAIGQLPATHWSRYETLKEVGRALGHDL